MSAPAAAPGTQKNSENAPDVVQSVGSFTPGKPDRQSGAFELDDLAKMTLEQFLCAYAQEGMIKAKTILDAAKVHKRMRPEMVEDGFAQVNQSIFFSAAPVPQRTGVISLKKGGAKKGPSTKPSNKGGEAAAEEDDPVAVEEEGQ